MWSTMVKLMNQLVTTHKTHCIYRLATSDPIHFERTRSDRPVYQSLQLLNPDASRPLLLRMVPGQPQRWPYWDFARLGQWSGAVSQDSSNWNGSCISWKVKKNSSDEKQRRKKSYLVALQVSSLSSLWCLVVLKCSFRVILLAFVSHEIIIFICDYIHYQGS